MSSDVIDQNRLILTEKIYKALSNKYTKSNKSDNNVESEGKSVKEEVVKESGAEDEDKTDKPVEKVETAKAMETDEVTEEQEPAALDEETVVDKPTNTEIAVEAN